MPTVGRNDPCPCGSGKKYKHCCLEKDKTARLRATLARAGAARRPAVIRASEEEAARRGY